MDETVQYRITLATEILMKCANIRREPISVEQTERLRALAESDEERAMEIDDLARQVIDRELKRIGQRPDTGSMWR